MGIEAGVWVLSETTNRGCGDPIDADGNKLWRAKDFFGTLGQFNWFF